MSVFLGTRKAVIMRVVAPKRAGEGNGGCLFLIAILVGGAIILILASNDKQGGPHIFVKPAIPVVISYRPSVIGAGKVAIFSNQTGNRLTITVEFGNTKTKQQKTGVIDLEANGKTEIGWAEGWMFESGETITISHPDYSSKILTIP